MARLIYSAIASADGYVRLDLKLLEPRTFASGAVNLRYRPKLA